jgi:molecular chaperone GrpE
MVGQGPSWDEDDEASAAQAADAAVERDIEELESELEAETVAVDEVRGDIERLEADLAERTADVQRLQAEYVNYRRRVDRDRDVARELAVGTVLGELLTVLDDIDRADEHGELVGGFRSVADTLVGTLTKLGLDRYGEVGDAFDPTIHEAMTHELSPDVVQTTCIRVYQPGYRLGERILRPARVGVAEAGQAS